MNRPDRPEFGAELTDTFCRADPDVARRFTRVKRATALARTLQQTLIPSAPPVIAGLEVGAVFEPVTAALDIGGDF